MQAKGTRDGGRNWREELAMIEDWEWRNEDDGGVGVEAQLWAGPNISAVPCVQENNSPLGNSCTEYRDCIGVYNKVMF